MADKVRTSYRLNVVANFNDGDTRSITVPNPKPAAELPALLATFQSLLQSTGALIGDKNEGTFTNLSDAKVLTTTEVIFDI